MSGRYSAPDAATALEALLVDGMPDRDLFMTSLDRMLERGLAAASSSPPQVTMLGEIAPILCASGKFDAMSILCAISTECLHDDGSDLMASVCGKHAVIVSSDS